VRVTLDADVEVDCVQKIYPFVDASLQALLDRSRFDSRSKTSAGHAKHASSVFSQSVDMVVGRARLLPVLEAFHWPAAEASQCQLSETAENAHFWHAGQGVKATDELFQKALGGFQSRLFLEIIKLFVDFPPCKRTNGKVWH
jgi:hypothetical protein